MRQRCHVSCITGASKWYWLTVRRGLLQLQQVRVEGEYFNFFCFFTFIHFPPSSLSLSFITSTISSISLLPFSGRWHKMTHKTWCVVKHQQFFNFCFFTFIHFPPPPLSLCLSSHLLSLLSLFSLCLGDDTKWPTRPDVSLNPNTIKKKQKLKSSRELNSFLQKLLPFKNQQQDLSGVSVHLNYHIYGMYFERQA